MKFSCGDCIGFLCIINAEYVGLVWFNINPKKVKIQTNEALLILPKVKRLLRQGRLFLGLFKGPVPQGLCRIHLKLSCVIMYIKYAEFHICY